MSLRQLGFGTAADSNDDVQSIDLSLFKAHLIAELQLGRKPADKSQRQALILGNPSNSCKPVAECQDF